MVALPNARNMTACRPHDIEDCTVLSHRIISYWHEADIERTDCEKLSQQMGKYTFLNKWGKTHFVISYKDQLLRA
jgi:hypothetical protein